MLPVSRRQVVDPPTKVYQAEMPIKQLTGNDEYFDRLGWGELEQVCSIVVKSLRVLRYLCFLERGSAAGASDPALTQARHKNFGGCFCFATFAGCNSGCGILSSRMDSFAGSGRRRKRCCSVVKSKLDKLVQMMTIHVFLADMVILPYKSQHDYFEDARRTVTNWRQRGADPVDKIYGMQHTKPPTSMLFG